MKTNQITVDNYRQDRLYPKVVLATARVLMESDEVSPVTILLKMGNLTPDGYDGWRRGRIPYLERVFQGSLPKANRILRIIGFHVHDLKMVPYQHEYKQNGKNKRLKFSKSGEANIEKRYCRHYKWNRSPEKKQEIIAQGLSYSQAARRK